MFRLPAATSGSISALDRRISSSKQSKSALCDLSGSKPPASNPPPEATLSCPEARGSTRPEASFAIAWVQQLPHPAHIQPCGPSAPRWTIHCEVEPSAERRAPSEQAGAALLRSRSNTMPFIRRTCAMRVSSVLDLRGVTSPVCGFDPSQTDSICSATRFCNPRAMVSTSEVRARTSSVVSPSRVSRWHFVVASVESMNVVGLRSTFHGLKTSGGCIAESADSQYLPTCED